MDTIDKIVKVMSSSRDMINGHQTFNNNSLEALRMLLEQFKKEIKAEVLEDLEK